MPVCRCKWITSFIDRFVAVSRNKCSNIWVQLELVSGRRFEISPTNLVVVCKIRYYKVRHFAIIYQVAAIRCVSTQRANSVTTIETFPDLFRSEPDSRFRSVEEYLCGFHVDNVCNGSEKEDLRLDD